MKPPPFDIPTLEISSIFLSTKSTLYKPSRHSAAGRLYPSVRPVSHAPGMTSRFWLARAPYPARSWSAPIVRPRPPPVPGPRLSDRPRKPHSWPDWQSDYYIDHKIIFWTYHCITLYSKNQRYKKSSTVKYLDMEETSSYCVGQCIENAVKSTISQLSCRKMETGNSRYDVNLS